jgi:ParB-like chromosome segregation protein Spo0J
MSIQVSKSEITSEFAGRGHLEAVVLERGQEDAVVPLAGHHRRAALAPLGHAFA